MRRIWDVNKSLEKHRFFFLLYGYVECMAYDSVVMNIYNIVVLLKIQGEVNLRRNG